MYAVKKPITQTVGISLKKYANYERSPEMGEMMEIKNKIIIKIYSINYKQKAIA